MQTEKFIGAIDEGTSSARFIIFRAGTDDIVAYHQIEVPSIYPHEGWVEQDPIILYNIVTDCINDAIYKFQSNGYHVKDIIAVGVTNQRESVVVWDKKTGKPLYNALIWLDNRTTTTVEDLISNIPNNARNINYLKPLCGLPLSPYFSALKLRWLHDNVAQVQKAMDEQTCLVGTIDSWLIYNLTQGNCHVTDVTNASRTMLMNIETLQWDAHLLKFFGVHRNILPEIRSSAEVYGKIEDAKLQALKDVPIASCLGDQHAALVGQQCLQRGQAKSTYGTGCFLLMNTGSSIVHSQHGLLTTVGYQLGKTAAPVYALEGSVAIAGAALSWMRDNLNLFDKFEEVEKLAGAVKDVNDVYFVPAFSGLYAPYWNKEARGVICGLSEDSTNEHIIRATLESICFQVRDILEVMHKDCGIPLQKLMVDGGMTVNEIFMQLQADLTGINVYKSRIAETTALGAALAAYSVVQPHGRNENYGFQVDDSKLISYKSLIKAHDRDDRYRKWKMAVERSFGWDTVNMVENGRDLFE